MRSTEVAMPINVGQTDRMIRIVLGVVLLSLLFVLEGNLRWLGLIGLVPLVTGLVRSCPIYSVLGLSSCPLRRS